MTGEPTHTASEIALHTLAMLIIRLQSEVSITLHCQLCSIRYIAVRIKNRSKSTSADKIATMKNTGDFCYEGKRHFSLSAKMNGTQRRALVIP